MNIWEALVFVLAYMCIWFVIAVIKKRNDVADTAWGLGFVVLAWACFLIGTRNSTALLVNLLVTVWGLRLAYHIHKRNHNKPEDARYQQWRAQWKYFYTHSFFQVFMLQGVLLWLIAWPIIVVNGPRLQTSLNGWSWLAVFVWCIGFAFESIGDAQLKRFIANPANKGKLMMSGLWKYSRHPNYFGEITQWWGIFIIAISLYQEWFLVVSPLTITVLIVFVSGISMTEKRYEGRADWAEYKKSTSALIPLPPRT